MILMLVLGRHECVRGKCYINKLVFSKSVSQGGSCRSRLAISSLDVPFKKCICTDYDYNESFCFLCFILLSTNLKAFYSYIIMSTIDQIGYDQLSLATKKLKLTFNE